MNLSRLPQPLTALLVATVALSPALAGAAVRPVQGEKLAAKKPRRAGRVAEQTKVKPTDDASVVDKASLGALAPAEKADVQAGPSAKPTAASRIAATDDTDAAAKVDRIEASKLYIWKRLLEENVPARMAAEGKFVTVHPISTDFGGSVRNPITGTGPLIHSVRETYVTSDVTSQAWAKASWAEARAYAHKLGLDDRIPASAGDFSGRVDPTLLARIANDHFSAYGRRVFAVDVDQNGNGSIDSVQSVNVQSKVKGALGQLRSVVTAQVVKDVAKATQPKQIGVVIAALTGVGGSIATANPVAMIAATAAAAVAIQSVTQDVVKDVRAAVAARQQAQTTAIGNTAQWARKALKTDDPPTALETYREYRAQLDTVRPGTPALSFEAFVGQLQLQRL